MIWPKDMTEEQIEEINSQTDEQLEMFSNNIKECIETDPLVDLFHKYCEYKDIIEQCGK